MIKSGFWQSSGSNPFWINIVEDRVFWMGMNQPSAELKAGEEWCHVGHGKINGNTIELLWSDIPIGQDKLHGKIIIEIIDDTHMKVIEDSVNFGKSEWEWINTGRHFSAL